ncbi:MAG: hypothetical protein OXG72_08155, partial [Acidobacteria bacterium]|nr:hypothetical protein [Acidobacteriota bacterium]
GSTHKLREAMLAGISSGDAVCEEEGVQAGLLLMEHEHKWPTPAGIETVEIENLGRPGPRGVRLHLKRSAEPGGKQIPGEITAPYEVAAPLLGAVALYKANMTVLRNSARDGKTEAVNALLRLIAKWLPMPDGLHANVLTGLPPAVWRYAPEAAALYHRQRSEAMQLAARQGADGTYVRDYGVRGQVDAGYPDEPEPVDAPTADVVRKNMARIGAAIHWDPETGVHTDVTRGLQVDAGPIAVEKLARVLTPGRFAAALREGLAHVLKRGGDPDETGAVIEVANRWSVIRHPADGTTEQAEVPTAVATHPKAAEWHRSTDRARHIANRILLHGRYRLQHVQAA